MFGVYVKGERVKYNGREYKVESSSLKNGRTSLRLRSLDGKCKMYGVDSRMVERVR